MRLQHALDHTDSDAWLESEARHPTIAGIGLAVVPADRIAQGVVARGAAERLDVLMLVERGNALRRHLTAEPIGFFQQHHAGAVPGSRKRSGDTPGAAAG